MYNKLYILLYMVTLSGCFSVQGPYNIVSTTDEQFVEEAHGRRCKETEMIIYPERIEYYTDCDVKRIVMTRVIPRPSPAPVCDNKQCKPSH